MWFEALSCVDEPIDEVEHSRINIMWAQMTGNSSAADDTPSCNMHPDAGDLQSMERLLFDTLRDTNDFSKTWQNRVRA